MRITDQMILSTTVQNLEDNETRLSSVENQLTSGNQLSQVSDDPATAARILGLQTSMALNDQYLRNDQAASAWLGATDSALSSVNNALTRAQELAVEAANGTQNSTDLQNIAAEATSLLSETVQYGNATYDGSYLFAGAQTTIAPFTDNNGSVLYNNSDPTSAMKQLTREIAPGTQVVVNTVGHDPTGGTGIFDQVFTALTGFIQALQTNNVSSIQTSIQQLSDAQNALSQARASIGGTMAQVTTTQDQLNLLGTRLSMDHSNLADTDYAQASTAFARGNTVRQASLAATAKSFPPTLFDYLT